MRAGQRSAKPLCHGASLAPPTGVNRAGQARKGTGNSFFLQSPELTAAVTAGICTLNR